MNAPTKLPRTAALFRSNRNQAVRIPRDMEFPEGVKDVYIRKRGRSLVIVPVNAFWDDFFDRPGIAIMEPEELPFEQREAF
jgi:antitoxin VapB